jgi:hypothetical protein
MAVARRVREKTLDSRDARTKLKARGKPYWRSIGPALHLGYRKGKDARRWVVRIYIGKGKYHTENIAYADDTADADGAGVLTFWQAQGAAREIAAKRTASSGQRTGPYTVGMAVEDYLVEHIADKPSHYEVKQRLAAYLPASLAAKDVVKLTKQDLVAWHRSLAKSPPRVRTKEGAKQRHRAVDMQDAETVRKRKDSANRVLGMLKAALNYAVTEERAPEGPWRRVVPFEAVAQARTRYLTIAECQRLLNVCDQDLRRLVQALLATGCRYQEVARLRVEDLNVDAGTLHVKQSKSGKSRHVVLTDEGQ